jgi:hypothetical protein
MSLGRIRPLVGATMAAVVGVAGYAIGKRRRAAATVQSTPAPPPAAGSVSPAASEANRIDALTKLKLLLDSGVLTREQYESEHARLTAAI